MRGRQAAHVSAHCVSRCSPCQPASHVNGYLTWTITILPLPLPLPLLPPPPTGSQMSYLWSCVNTDDLTPCFGKQQDGQWMLNTTQVKTVLWNYYFWTTIARRP